jgi:hypothetical protein
MARHELTAVSPDTAAKLSTKEWRSIVMEDMKKAAAEREFNLAHYTKMPRGPYFACLEQPPFFLSSTCGLPPEAPEVRICENQFYGQKR